MVDIVKLLLGLYVCIKLVTVPNTVSSIGFAGPVPASRSLSVTLNCIVVVVGFLASIT